MIGPLRYRLRWVCLIGMFLSALLFAGCGRRSATAIPAHKQRQLATVLYNQRLYPQAIRAYEAYLNNYPLSPEEQAGVCFQIASIYFDKLHDYENALAYYLRITELYPESKVAGEAKRQMVACLERLKRSTDARQVMEETAALSDKQKPHSQPGAVVARIGNREITLGDLNFEISHLPPTVREQLNTPEKKRQFLRDYIVQELLYDSALRQGLDKDPEVRAGVLQAEKALMAQKLLEKELKNAVRPEQYTDADVQMYYQANKERYAERDKKGNVIRIRPFSEVADQVAKDFIQEKQQQAYQAMLDRLMRAENVVIYDDRVR